MALNCAGIENLLESELFGYQRGALPTQSRPNLDDSNSRRAAHLLDEIGEMSPSAQAKLLRVLEHRQVDPLGDTRSIRVDIRVIGATTKICRLRSRAIPAGSLLSAERLPTAHPAAPRTTRRYRTNSDVISGGRPQGSRLSHQGHHPAALIILQDHDGPATLPTAQHSRGSTIACKDGVTPTGPPPCPFGAKLLKDRPGNRKASPWPLASRPRRWKETPHRSTATHRRQYPEANLRSSRSPAIHSDIAWQSTRTLIRMLKQAPTSFSAQDNPQRSHEATPPVLSPLRPRWMACLSILT